MQNLRSEIRDRKPENNHLHMNHRPTNVVAVIAFLAVTCLAQNGTTNDATATRVDEYIKLEQQLQRIPGISLAVIRDGQIVLARGYGFANLEHQVPAKPETIFQSGSVGKQFTATAVMMLVADGKLNLEDKINKYFSDAPADWQNITIRHLLTHTAGTTDYPRDFDFRRDYSEAELLKRAEAIPPHFNRVKSGATAISAMSSLEFCSKSVENSTETFCRNGSFNRWV